MAPNISGIRRQFPFFSADELETLHAKFEEL